MALEIVISSDLPYQDEYPYVQGNGAVPIVINVYNDDVDNSVQLRQIYITEADSALGSGAALSLGMPVFKSINTSNSTANNVIPPDSEIPYLVEWLPQVPATNIDGNATVNVGQNLGQVRYTVKLISIAQVWGSTEMYRSEPFQFFVYPSAVVSYNLVTPVKVWSLYDNQRPTNNENFDFSMSVEAILENGNTVVLPRNQVVFASSESGLVSANTGDWGATEGNNSKIIGGDGSFQVGTWSPTVPAVITAYPYNYSNPPIASTKVYVVDALPQTLTITPELTNINWVNGATSTIKFKALLTKTNGVVEDVSGSPYINWRINGLLYGDWAYFLDVVGNNRSKLFLTNDNNELNPYSATSGIITATYSPSYTITGQANISVRKTV